MNLLKKLIRGVCAAAIAAAFLLPAVSARAEYPEHPIRAVIPFDVGGASDILARLYAEQLGRKTGQNVIIENKPGAGGSIGISSVAKSKGDGYTLLFSSTATTNNPAMFKNLPWDPFKDIVPVAEMCVEDALLAVNTTKVQANTLTEFVELARKNPGKFNAAAGGVGTRLSVELFRLQNDLSVQIIQYNSAGAATTAVLSGEADFAIVSPSTVIAPISSGKVRGLAVTGEKRLSSFPQVPTTTEAGMPGYQFGFFFGVYAPGGTPQDVIRKLNAVMNEITAQADTQERLDKLGQTPVRKTPEEFAKLYRDDIARWKDVVAKAKIPTLD